VRRVRLKTGRTALVGAATVTALLAFLPMRLAMGWLGLEAEGLSARSVSGTVWGGRLTEARFGDLALGDLRAGLSPLPLLLGRARVSLRGPGDQPALRGVLTVGRHLLGVDELTASLPTGRVFAPLPVAGLALDGLSVRFRDGNCEAAAGRVRADVSGDLGGVTLPPSLSGPVRCEGAALLVPLASQAGTEGVTLRVTGDGRYRARLSIRPSDPLAGQRLEQAGFVAGPNGYDLSVEGRF